MEPAMILRGSILLASLMLVKKSSANCRSAIDIGIMLDSSTSVGEYQFDAAKRFGEDLVRSLDVAPAKHKVALIHFNSDTHLDFGFKTYEFAEDVAAAIRNISYSPGSTSVDQALGFAERNMFTHDGGMRSRLDAPVKFLIIFTDGFIPQNAPPISEVLETYVNQDTFIYRLIVKTGFYYSEPDLHILVDEVKENVVKMMPESLDILIELIERRTEHLCNIIGF